MAPERKGLDSRIKTYKMDFLSDDLLGAVALA